MNAPGTTRLYVVAATDTGKERIIRAESKAKAVAASAVARIASQSDLERLLVDGVLPENSEAFERANPSPTRAKARTTTHRSTRNV
jgi:hypothetical protein